MKNSLVTALVAAALCGSAYAYRPFDATDASVADPGTLELEMGLAKLHAGSSRVWAMPAVVASYGVGGGTEIGVESRVDRIRDGADGLLRTRVEDAAINVKHVLRAGSLQEAVGPSIGAECSLLLPRSGSSETLGTGCSALLSQQWDAFTGHLNVGIERTPERTTARSLSLVGEGPERWPVRPVTELHWDADNTGGWERSALAGVIVPCGKNLAFDLAWREGRSSEGPVHELRAGLTLTFAPGGAKTE